MRGAKSTSLYSMRAVGSCADNAAVEGFFFNPKGRRNAIRTVLIAVVRCCALLKAPKANAIVER